MKHQINAEILSHSLECQCKACKVFFWTLFVTNNERDIMEADVKPSLVAPLEPEDAP